MLSRLVFELWDEVRLFLMEHGSQLADHLTDPDWLTRLVYLSCIFEKLNGLDMSLQGKNTSIMSLNDKIHAFTGKLEHWTERVEMCRIDMFSELDKLVKKSITTHLQALLEHFNKYFPEETAPEQYDWIRSPFTVTTANHLTSDLEDALVELSSERTLKTALIPRRWLSFGFLSRGNTHSYPRPLDVLVMPFGTTYIYMC